VLPKFAQNERFSAANFTFIKKKIPANEKFFDKESFLGKTGAEAPCHHAAKSKHKQADPNDVIRQR